MKKSSKKKRPMSREYDLFLSKRYILDSILSVYGKQADFIKGFVYCQMCGLKIFGPGSLFRMNGWKDRCRCVAGRGETLSHTATYEDGCLFVWHEVQL